MIFVTGASGFLGAAVIELLLERGEKVRGLRRRGGREPISRRLTEVEWVYGDVRDPASLRTAMAGVDAVYHVAGKNDFNPKTIDEMRGVNEDGARNVLEEAKRAGVRRVVHTSTVGAIGGSSGPGHLLNEDDFGKGTGVDVPYPQTKYRAEKIALEFAAGGLDVVIASPTFFVGPDDV
ncbi:MAG: NAD-dependent epimerase/dehydratase family protein, partial [Planctomycetia bacterium]